MQIRINFALVAKMQIKELMHKGKITQELGNEILEILVRIQDMSQMNAYTKSGIQNDYRELASKINQSAILFDSFSEILVEFKEQMYV